MPGADRFHGGPSSGSPGDDPGDLQRVGRELGVRLGAQPTARPHHASGERAPLSPRKVLVTENTSFTTVGGQSDDAGAVAARLGRRTPTR